MPLNRMSSNKSLKLNAMFSSILLTVFYLIPRLGPRDTTNIFPRNIYTSHKNNCRQNEVAPSYHRVRRLYFLVVIFHEPKPFKDETCCNVSRTSFVMESEKCWEEEDAMRFSKKILEDGKPKTMANLDDAKVIMIKIDLDLQLLVNNN